MTTNYSNFNKYKITAVMELRKRTNDGIIAYLPRLGLNILHMVPLMFLWTVLAESGVEIGMSLTALLSYTYVNMMLGDILTVQTMLSKWNYSGELTSLFTRPYPVFGQVVSITIGSWLLNLILLVPVMVLLAPFIGVNIIPASPMFFLSLILCISLGFAIDLIFACIGIYLQGVTWLVHSIRMALVSLFSGEIIPFAILPFGLENIFKFQPFGSLNAAPLSIFVGTADIAQVIITQIAWNIILWIVAVVYFRKSREKLVSYGG